MATKRNRTRQQPYVENGEDGGEYRAYGFGGNQIPKGAYEKKIKVKEEKDKIPTKKQETKVARTKEEQDFIEGSIGPRVEAIEKPTYVKKSYEELKKEDDLAIADWFKPTLYGRKNWDGTWSPTGVETEKAIQVDFGWESADGEYDGTEKGWIPKSAFISAKYKKDYEQRREHRLQTEMEKGFDNYLRVQELAIKYGIIPKDVKRKHSIGWFADKFVEIGKEKEIIGIVGEEKVRKSQEFNYSMKTHRELVKVYQQTTPSDDRKAKTLAYWSFEKLIDRIGKSKLTEEQQAIVERAKGLINERKNNK